MRRIMLDLHGVTITSEERELLQHPQVGGVILFTRNYHSPEQLQELIQTIRQTSRAYLLIAVDHEGGRVQRFREGFTRLPPLAVFGELYQSDKNRAQQLAETAGWLMAIELLVFAIDVSFAPVLDLNKNICQVIGDRAFHGDPQIVAELARAYIKGMRKAGMAAVGKHFPGHGSVAPDSHIAVPVDPRSLSEITAEDLIPFKLLANELTGVMPAHIIYSAVDDKPAGFAALWLQKILREQLNFNGAIFSDDLSMAGAVQMGDLTERTKLALTAGCDMALLCNDRAGAIQVLENLERQPIKSNEQTPQRLQKMQGKNSYTRADLSKLAAWQQAVTAVSNI